MSYFELKVRARTHAEPNPWVCIKTWLICFESISALPYLSHVECGESGEVSRSLVDAY